MFGGGWGGWIGAAGAAIDFVGGIIAADDARDAARANARAAEEAARREKEATRLRLERLKDEGRRLRGEQVAQFAASGVGLSGSALDIMADTAAQLELDAKLIEAGGALNETFYRNQARQQREAGRAAFTGGLLTSAAGLMGNAYSLGWGD